jgi:ketosteroid isomerase-like protein
VCEPCSMTSPDADVLRDLFAAANQRDFARAMSYYAPDIELVVASGLEAGTYSGRDAVGAWFGNWYSSFAPGARFELEEIHDTGSGSLLVVAKHHARGRTSGAAIVGEVVWLYGLRDSKVIRIEIFESRAQAFAAAGLSAEGA